MNKIKNIFLHTSFLSALSFFIAAPLLVSCEKDFDLDRYRNPEIEKMLVVNSLLNPDSVIGVSVTRPYFFTDAHLVFNPVTGLEVEAAVDEGEWERLAYDSESGLYSSHHKPAAGQCVSIRVNGEEQMMKSYDVVPHKVDLKDVKVSMEGPVHIYRDNDYRITYKLTFDDPAGEDNYYFLTIKDDAESYGFSQMGQPDFTADYVFQVLAEMINRDVQGWKPDGVFGYPFCDRGIDGERYTLTVSEVLQSPLTWYIETLPRKIQLYSISKPYFEYMVSVLAMDYDQEAFKGNLLSLGLMEPDKVYSNIEGGAGLMGSYNLSTIRMDILKECGGWPE